MSFNNRVSDMLFRVKVFAGAHPNLFLKDTTTGRLMEEVLTAADGMSGSHLTRTFRLRDNKALKEKRVKARLALVEQLQDISRSAAALQIGEFWMSADRSDRSLLAMGGTFLGQAQEHRQAFIDANLPADFLDRLSGTLEALSKTLSNQADTMSKQISATSGIDRARDAALDAMARLDPLVENLLRSDHPTLAAWRSARHVARYTSRPRRSDSAIAAKTSSPAVEGVRNDRPAA